MNFKDVLEYWKAILVFIVVVVSSTIGVLAWAEDQKQLMRAEQNIIHNVSFQEDRIITKQEKIKNNLTIIKLIQADDDEPSIKEQKLIDSLEQENIRLFSDIEEIQSMLRENEE